MDICGSDKKILIVGSGGVGGFYGAKLAYHGYNVTFLARGEHYRAIISDGLRVKSLSGDFHVAPAKAVETIISSDTPDIILFCVKTYDTEKVATELNQIVADNCILISIQNGVDNDKLISQYLKKGKIFPGLAHIISTKTAAGEISHTGAAAELIFGDRIDSENKELILIEKMMKDSGINARLSTNFEVDEWRKFILITSFAGMTSACRMPIGGILEDSRLYELLKKSVLESIAVAKANNIMIEPDLYQQIIKRLEAYRGAQAGSKSSMLKDIEAGRPTEIEFLNGHIIRLGKQLGIATPVHDRIKNSVDLGIRL